MSAFCVRGPRFNPGPGIDSICIPSNVAIAASIQGQCLISAPVHAGVLFMFDLEFLVWFTLATLFV